MLKRLNFQYLLSYLGLFPFFFILIDKYFFLKIKEEITLSFLIYYILTIFVFIGSTNWNFQTKLSNYVVIYGFLPSLISVILIVFNLYNYNPYNIIAILILFFAIQLLLDYILIYIHTSNKNVFYFLRLPLTLTIIILSGIIII